MMKMCKRMICLVLLAVMALALVACGKEEKPMRVEVEIEVAEYGTIRLKLDREKAPITVDNFLKLVEEGFYNGLTFHRAVEGFMIQGGDPNADGTGHSAERIKGEFAENGVENPISHTRGTISMARSEDPNSASCQFFIMQENGFSLDGKYAAFGTVTEGMEVVDAICNDIKPRHTNEIGVILDKERQSVITEIRIIED